MYDVTVVGAGPAGGYAAYLLARQGHNVLIIDRARFPREKTCGGGISNKTVELLEFDISPVVHRRVVGAYLTYRNQDPVVRDLGERGGAAVVRSEFDWYILQKAIDAGATFLGETPFEAVRIHPDWVEVVTGHGTFRAAYLLGADGVYSSVRASHFGRDVVTYAPAMEALVYVPDSVLARFENRVLFDFGGMPKGYGWIFPKKDHLNAGVFSIFPRRGIREDLQQFMRYYRSLSSSSKITYLGYSIPIANRKHVFQKERVLLLGDAAGFAESFYGEGIYFALKSALVAAEAVHTSFSKPRDQVYSSLVKKSLHADIHYSELTARLFYPFQKFGFYRMVQNIHVNSYFAELIAGRVGYRECFYKTLLTSPYWMFSRRYPAYEGEPF